MWQQGKDSLNVLSRCAWRKTSFWECVLQSASTSTPFAKLIFNSLANDIQNHRECNISILKLEFFLFFFFFESEFGKPSCIWNSVGDPLKTVWVFFYLFMNKWKYYSRRYSLSVMQAQHLWWLRLAECGFCVLSFEPVSIYICWFSRTFFCQNARLC